MSAQGLPPGVVAPPGAPPPPPQNALGVPGGIANADGAAAAVQGGIAAVEASLQAGHPPVQPMPQVPPGIDPMSVEGQQYLASQYVPMAGPPPPPQQVWPQNMPENIPYPVPQQMAPPGPAPAPPVAILPPAPAAQLQPEMGKVELFDHLDNSASSNFTKVFAVGAPDPVDGAHARYEIEWQQPDGQYMVLVLGFQDGPVKEAGVNGVTEEALLNVLMHRLGAFQNSRYACRETACARTRVQEALMWLGQRTKARIIAGTEGTREKV